MLMRFDPFREFERFTQQTAGQPDRPSVIPMDAYRHGDRFTVHFDLPGVDSDSINLTVEKNVLAVSAERNWRTENGVEIVVSERPQGRFSRQLFLGDSLDADRIEADYANGVLTITIPVADHAKPRRVAVTSTGDQRSIRPKGAKGNGDRIDASAGSSRS